MKYGYFSQVKILLLSLPIVFLLALPLSANMNGLYTKATIDDRGQLHIKTKDQREILPKKYKDQVSFDKPLIAEDRTTIGWLALYPNCCTSYPIPLKLVISRDGKILRTFQVNSLPLWNWHFEGNDKQVAFAQETVHGHIGVHFELRDIRSGRLIAYYDGDPTPNAPKWVHDVANL